MVFNLDFIGHNDSGYCSIPNSNHFSDVYIVLSYTTILCGHIIIYIACSLLCMSLYYKDTVHALYRYHKYIV